MKRFRYDTSGNWYKGNTHIHTTASDGGMSPLEVTQRYSDAGYDFLYLTDHWVASDAASLQDSSPLLLMDGMEIHGNDTEGAAYHVVCLGSCAGITEDMGLVPAMQAAREGGAMLILAHPLWCGNTMDDARRWNFDGVEVYNHVVGWLNGKSDGLAYWNDMLRANPNVLAVAADDSHSKPAHPVWNGGWIMVNAAELTREAVTTAMKAGNFYSSCGPEFHAIELDGENLNVRVSPSRFIRLVGPAYRGRRAGHPDGPLVTEAAFELPADWDYAYIEIEDDRGRRAWTNTLLPSQ